MQNSLGISLPLPPHYAAWLLVRVLGSSSSGNYGHAGRPGEVGGSGQGEGGLVRPGGILATIASADGGFTYSPATGDQPTAGFALSVHPGHEKVLDIADVNLVSLAQYAKDNWTLLKQSGNYMGAWHNPDDHRVYLDVSTVVKTAHEAEALARQAHQLAYFDLVQGKSVTVEGGDHGLKTNTTFNRAEKRRALLSRLNRHDQGDYREGSDRRTNSTGEEDVRGLARKETLVHAVADAYVDRLSVAILYAFAKGRLAVHADQLNHANSLGEADAAMSAAPDAVKVALEELLPPTLQKIVMAGGDAGLAMLQTTNLRAALKKSAPVTMKFVDKNDAAITWVKQHALALADDLSQTSRKNIKAALVKAFSGEINRRELNKTILAAVGDKDRALLISRTETMRASNQGQLLSWGQAVEEGLLTGREQKTWIVTDDERLCPECEELDGETVPLDEDFSNGEDAPPAHVLCRCNLGLSK